MGRGEEGGHNRRGKCVKDLRKFHERKKDGRES